MFEKKSLMGNDLLVTNEIINKYFTLSIVNLQGGVIQIVLLNKIITHSNQFITIQRFREAIFLSPN